MAKEIGIDRGGSREATIEQKHKVKMKEINTHK